MVEEKETIITHAQGCATTSVDLLGVPEDKAEGGDCH